MPEDWGRGRSERFPGPLRGGGDPPRGRGEEAPPARSPTPPHRRPHLPKNNSGSPGPGGAATVPPTEPGRRVQPGPGGSRARQEAFPGPAARNRRKGTSRPPIRPPIEPQRPSGRRDSGAARRRRPSRGLALPPGLLRACPALRAPGPRRAAPLRAPPPPRFGLLAAGGRPGGRSAQGGGSGCAGLGGGRPGCGAAPARAAGRDGFLRG